MKSLTEIFEELYEILEPLDHSKVNPKNHRVLTSYRWKHTIAGPMSDDYEHKNRPGITVTSHDKGWVAKHNGKKIKSGTSSRSLSHWVDKTHVP